MKKIILATISFVAILLASCSKKEVLQQIQKAEEVKTAPLNIDQPKILDSVLENKEKTEAGLRAAQLRGENPSNFSNLSEGPTRVILIQNGGTVTDANWNNGITFTVTPYGNADTLEKAINIAEEHYAMFNVVVTTDPAVFYSFDIWHRSIIIVGETEVLGQYPGYAWKNCYLWGLDTPGFVLTNKCNPNAMATDIGHLIAHESGHQYGLDHEYITWGLPNLFLSGASIMGQFAQRTFINWSAGNIAYLIPILGVKDDDFVNTRTAWICIPENTGLPLRGILTSGDIDVGRFYPSTTQATTFTVKCGDAPVVVELWRNGVKKFSLNTNSTMTKSVQIPKGTVPYILVIKISNTNCRHTTWWTNKTQG